MFTATGGITIDATTEGNIETAIDTLANLTAASALVTVGTITTGTWNAGAITSSGLITGNANLNVANGATTAGVLTLLEDTDAGSNFASFQVPALAANTVYTLPVDDGAASEVLSTDGAGVLDWVAAGAGDITDVFSCASGDCASITMAATDLLNMSGTDASTTTEGLILPQHATACAGGTAEGQVCWEADADTLYIGNGATLTAVGSGSDTNADKRFWIPASACEPLEAADSIPPLSKFTGTNIDIFTRSFDAATDEGCKATIVIPEDVQSGSTITFGFVWFSRTATANATVWNVRYTATGADNEAWDAALTTETVTCTVAGTVNLRDICEVTETLANTGWAANDVISVQLYRDADHASDTLVGDAELEGVYIDVPRA